MAPRLTLLLLAALALALPGCSGCVPAQPAAAQDDLADAGVVTERVVVVPIPVPSEREPEPEAPATCYEVASARTSLTDVQIGELCIGAWSAAPIECYLDARARLRITDPQRIGLCRCADSTAPVDCFRRLSRARSLTDVQVEQLCAPVIARGLLENCRPAGGF